jgi:hypothetical protein
MRRQQMVVSSGRSALQVRMVSSGEVSHGLIQGAGVEIGIDYSKAELPDRAYYADYATAISTRSGKSLIFGKLGIDQRSLRTMIEVVYPPEFFERQFSTGILAELYQGLKRVAAEKKWLAEKLDVRLTDTAQSFRANNCFVGMWGDDALIDFYWISPKDMHGFIKNHGGDVSLDPVVRIVMGTSILIECLDAIHELSTSMKSETL